MCAHETEHHNKNILTMNMEVGYC